VDRRISDRPAQKDSSHVNLTVTNKRKSQMNGDGDNQFTHRFISCYYISILIVCRQMYVKKRKKMPRPSPLTDDFFT